MIRVYFTLPNLLNSIVAIDFNWDCKSTRRQPIFFFFFARFPYYCSNKQEIPWIHSTEYHTLNVLFGCNNHITRCAYFCICSMSSLSNSFGPVQPASKLWGYQQGSDKERISLINLLMVTCSDSTQQLTTPSLPWARVRHPGHVQKQLELIDSLQLNFCDRRSVTFPWFYLLSRTYSSKTPDLDSVRLCGF